MIFPLIFSKEKPFSLVGESGSGKSTTGRALLRLYKSQPMARFSSKGKDIANLKKGKELLEFRKEAQMIFQDHMHPRRSYEGA